MAALALPPEPRAAMLQRIVRLLSVTEKVRVLRLDGYPRWEYRFLNRMLKRADERLEVQCWLLSATSGFLQESSQDLPSLKRLPSSRRELLDNYDVVILDCPPQLGFLTLGALCSATGVLLTVHPQMLDVASMSQFLLMASDLMQVVRQAGAEVEFDFFNYVLTRYEPRDGPQAQVAAFLRNLFGERVLTNTMVKSTAIADAGLSKQTLYEVGREGMNRATYDRAIESLDAVNGEIEALIRAVWDEAPGRAAAGRSCSWSNSRCSSPAATTPSCAQSSIVREPSTPSIRHSGRARARRSVMSAGPLKSGMMEFIRNYAVDGQVDLAFSVANAAKDVGYYRQMAGDLGLESRMSTAADATLREARDGGDGGIMVPEMVDWMAKHLGSKQS